MNSITIKGRDARDERGEGCFSEKGHLLHRCRECDMGRCSFI